MTLPSQPPKSDFSLKDLDEQAKKEESVKLAWREKLQAMKVAFDEVILYENREISTSLKVKAWERFRYAFSANNPYSHEDDKLLRKSKKQITYWKSKNGTIKTSSHSASNISKKNAPSMDHDETVESGWCKSGNMRVIFSSKSESSPYYFSGYCQTAPVRSGKRDKKTGSVWEVDNSQCMCVE